MAISRSLRSLLHVRDLEEDQQKALLGAALAELNALEAALEAARASRRIARTAMGNASALEDPLARRAYELEAETHMRRAGVLAERCETTRERVQETRALYLEKRVERRRAEVLIEAAQVREDVEGERRQQRDLDDWYAQRSAGSEREEE